MSILINRETRVVVCGISGRYGSNQTKGMLDYGTRVVAGVTPGKGGLEVHGVPVYDTLEEVQKQHAANAAVIYVPGPEVLNAGMEVINASIRLIMIATEGVPLQDTMKLRSAAEKAGAWLFGPNTIGMISPGECLVGSLAPGYAQRGNVGVVSRGGTVTIETIRILSEGGVGQSTCVGAGGDKVIGRNPVEYLRLFEDDPQTKAIVLIGEIGGQKENECADVISQINTPVYAYIVGRTAPSGARMGHIGAIIGGESESFEAKRKVLRDAGATVVDTPWELAERLAKAGFR